MSKNYFPLFFKISDRKILVVGGGDVAERKVRQLLNFGAEITLIAPDITAGLRALSEEKRLRWHKRKYIGSEAGDYSLVIATTDNSEINRQIYDDAIEKNIPINVVDQPEFCTIFFPSIINRGNMTFAIGSDGKAPFYTRAVRKQLDDLVPQDISHKAALAEAFRTFIMENRIEGDVKQVLVEKFLIEIESDHENWEAENPPLTTWKNWIDDLERP